MADESRRERRKWVLDQLKSDPVLPLVIPRSPKGEELARGPRPPELLTEREAGVRQMTGDLERQGGAMGAAMGENAINSALFGQLPNIVGAVGGEGAEELSRQRFEALNRLHPVASGVGSVGGLFVPGSPAGQAANLSARAGARAVRPLSRAVEGAGPAVTAELSRRAAARMLENLAGSATSLTSYNLLAEREERASLVDRLQDSVDQMASPLNLGLTAGASVLQSRIGREIDREMRNAGLRFEQERGIRLPVETYFANSSSRATFQGLSQLPGGVRRRVSRLENKIIAGIADEVDSIAKRVSGRGYSLVERGTSAPAANAVRRIGGVREEGARGKLQENATQRFQGGVQDTLGGLDSLVPRAEMKVLRDAIKDLRATRPQTETSRLEPILRNLEKISTMRVGGVNARTPINLRDLEGLRKNLAYLRQFKDLPGISSRAGDRTRYEAGMLYDVVAGIEQRAFPAMANALDDISKLRKMQEALPRRAFIDLDDQVVHEFFKPGPGMLKRWEAAEATGMPGDLDVLRGHYFTQLLDHAIDPKTGSLSSEKLIKAFNRPGRFNRQAFDLILPEGERLRRELIDRARLHERLFGDTRLATTGRGSGMALATGGTLATIGAAAGTAGWLLSNPYSAIPLVLGPIALQVMITRSLVGGRGERAILGASTGTAPVGRSAVAAQEVYARTPSMEAPNLPIRINQGSMQ